MKSPLILIDASSYFFRAYHALPPLTNSKGQPTGAIYGVVNMIKKLIKDYQPQELAVVFDAKGKTFRDEWYPEYKAHRPPMPDDLSSQFAPLIKLLKVMGLPLLIIEGVEADDVIGTLAHQATAIGRPVIISTSDKDMAQLVNEHVTLINTMSNYLMDVDGVKVKFGVKPEQMIDYLTLIGDAVDNVPGVPKCGPKTAVKWLNEYHTLDNLVQNSHQITGKIGDSLRNSLSHLPLSRKLVTIKTDVQLPLTLNELSIQKASTERLIELVRDLEFKNWLKELLINEAEEHTAQPSTTASRSYDLITNASQLDIWTQKLNQSKSFSLSIQSSDTDPMVAEIIGIALALEDKAAYIPLKHQDEGLIQLPEKEVLTVLRPFVESPNLQKISANNKFDTILFKNRGIAPQGMTGDTMLASYVLNSNAGPHHLRDLALKHLGQQLTSYEDMVGKGAKQVSFCTIPVDKAGHYVAENAYWTYHLFQQLMSLFDESLLKVYQEIEIPLVPILADMERTGVLINPTTLKHHGARLKQRIEILEEEALELAQKPFNLNSPKQLQEILFDNQKLPIITRTPTGQPSTAESVLQELAYDYRLPAIILEHRSLTKLVSTYIDALPKKINAKTQRVHTSYNQAIAATGRLSSSEPNLQNIPIRSEEGRLIRTAFIAPPGHVLLAADYSQIELRIMAHLSQDENLLNAFAHGWDIHSATAAEIFQTPLQEVTQEQRRRSKAVNFGLIYGMSAFGLAKQLGVERQDAQYYIDTYFTRYPRVLAYMERTRQQAHQQGYVETVFGRRLYLPEINVRNTMRQKAAERMAINAPMQGTAADIIKKAMITFARWQKEQLTPSARMIMQVHDELVFEVPEEQLDLCQKIIPYIMEKTVQLSVPLVVSIGIGANWDEAH